MKKATQKSAPVTLGTKRTCPKCATKFYDFNKQELVCPKCETMLDPQASMTSRFPPEAKKAAKVHKPVNEGAAAAGSDEVVMDESDAFESAEELGDEDEEIVEDLSINDEENESY